MADLRKLLNRLSEAEGKLRAQRFLAPCVRGGQLPASVAGLLYTFTPQPPDFEGWGIFQPADEKSARLVEEASLARVGAYLHLFPALRLRLADRLRGSAWLAYPVNESDMRQRFPAQQVRPLPVHLVTE